MTIINSIILDIILVIFPLMIYLIYIAYSSLSTKKESALIFTLTVFTQMYMCIKYSIPLYKQIPIFMINIPLILSYTKKDKSLIMIISILTVIYYYTIYPNYIIILMIEYVLYYLLFLKSKNIWKFISIFTIIKLIEQIIINKNINIEIIIECALLFIVSVLVIHSFNKTKEMLKLHITIKQINENEQIKSSLFKITHEIKNPIAVCKGYLEMYDENKIDKTKKYIPIIKEEIDRTLILLEDFLSINSLKINKEILDINLLLEEAIKNMKILFKKNHIKVDFNIDDDEIYINGDYNRLMQVLINVLKNSLEAMENKKDGIIKITTKQVNDKINIYIKDNGIGMSKETLNKIKTPFYTTKEKGTGLGVSLSNEIIKALNGKLTYKSKENKYTEVIITLPLEKAI